MLGPNVAKMATAGPWHWRSLCGDCLLPFLRGRAASSGVPAGVGTQEHISRGATPHIGAPYTPHTCHLPLQGILEEAIYNLLMALSLLRAKEAGHCLPSPLKAF